MKIINSKKYAVKFNELYDYVDDNTVEQIDEYDADNVEIVDYDALEQGEIPVMKVDDQGIESILTDNIEDSQSQEDTIEEEPLEEPTEEIAIEGEDVPDFASVYDAMKWAIENSRVVKIFYTTKGENRGRGGKKHLLREKGLSKNVGGGVNIYRIVEPHYMYQAGNGNLVLVTYDRSVRHIRAFIINNITDYNFTKNRNTKKPQHFKPRIRVIPKSNKGIDIMKNTNENLAEIASEVELKGMVKSASIIRDAEQVMSKLKTAQYVGVQGYWIRNRRCWDNCYRQKRTMKPKTPAQEVWMECWDEYRKSINNNESGWEKYAEKDKTIKLSFKGDKKKDELFSSKVEEKTKKGFSTPEAIYATIEEESQKYKDEVLNSASALMTLAETLNNNDMKELGDRLANISTDMLKEAGIWQGIKNIGKGISDAWGGGKKKEDPVSIKQKLFNFSKIVRQLAEKIRQNIKYVTKTPSVASSESKIIIESQNYRDRTGRFQNTERLMDEATIENELYNTQKPQPQLSPESSNASPEQRNTINQVNAMAYQADALASWINTNVSIDNPDEKAIADRAVGSLTQSANQLRSFMTSGDINNEGVAQKLEEMAQGATLAVSLVGASSLSGELSQTSVAPSQVPTSTQLPTGGPFQGSPSGSQSSTGANLTLNRDVDINALMNNPQLFTYIKNLVDSINSFNKNK